MSHPNQVSRPPVPVQQNCQHPLLDPITHSFALHGLHTTKLRHPCKSKRAVECEVTQGPTAGSRVGVAARTRCTHAISHRTSLHRSSCHRIVQTHHHFSTTMGSDGPRPGDVMRAITKHDADTPEADKWAIDMNLMSLKPEDPPGGDDGAMFVLNDGTTRAVVTVLDPRALRVHGVMGQTTDRSDAAGDLNHRHIGLLLRGDFVVVTSGGPLAGRVLRTPWLILDWHGDRSVHVRLGTWGRVLEPFTFNGSSGGRPFQVVLLEDLAAVPTHRDAIMAKLAHLGLSPESVRRLTRLGGVAVTPRVGWATRTTFDDRAALAGARHCGDMADMVLGRVCVE